MNADLRRNARLILGPDAALDVMPRALLDAARPRRTGPRAIRVAQRLAMRRGRLTFERTIIERERARRETLGQVRLDPPRFLVRVDEFPHWLADDEPARYGTESFKRFHAILSEHGVPYLLAVVPRPSERPLDPRGTTSRPLTDSDLETLRAVQADGAELAVHGLDHRTRDTHPRRQSELLGRSAAEVAERLEQADEELAPLAARPRVFVPPWNRFDRTQWPVLARRFDIICGGPESVMQVGFHSAPTWWGDAVYLPSYTPFYEHAEHVTPAVRRALDRNGGGWIPIVLHWGWEADDGWKHLPALARALAGHAAPWREFLAEIDTAAALPAATAAQ